MPNLNGFDADNVEPVPEFEPIPAGKYLAMIAGSEDKVSKQGHTYLSLEFEVIEGQYAGRKLWTNLNLNHPDADVVKYARAELASICKAVGVLKPQDSTQLHNLPLLITVKCVTRKDSGDLQNRIKGYARKEAAAGQPQQAAPGSTTPPWRRQG
ncbi:MAG: DUF669 domain-containing protein [Planctomycetes bacterium]|nr:DUF669 domain-containing protein [Planctomycetota bacterium]